jgi:TPR repeat protein
LRIERFSSGALLDNNNNKKLNSRDAPLLRHSSGERHMVEQASHYRSYDPDIEGYDEDLSDHRIAAYRFGQSGRTESNHDGVPLFLSDSDGEPHPSEYMTPSRRIQRTSISSRILAGVLAAAAMAILVALISSDATRDLLVYANASLAAVVPAPSAAAQPNPTQLTANDIQLKDPARLPAPANQALPVRSVTTVAVAPSRAEITSAYQSALQGRAPLAVTSTAASPARAIDTDELATLLKRARSLIAIGDIAAARLLLERAAEAREASAALLLAQTYDPAVLGAPDMRSITPDPAMARDWYRKAAQFGSPEAELRLAQIQY